MGSWRDNKQVLGVTETLIVKLLRYAPWYGQVDELAHAVDAPVSRTWHAIARLTERGLVFAQAGDREGEISARLTNQAGVKLKTIRLANDHTRRTRIVKVTTRAGIERRKSA